LSIIRTKWCSLIPLKWGGGENSWGGYIALGIFIWSNLE
jgi:hypothetical protein